MASKKDLTEAQSFSRRRLLTAFTSGAVGSRELEPAKPLRAVVAGVSLAALVVVGGVFYGLLNPGLPEGWENNRLVLAKDTGARYVSANGVLYPVLNTSSARLLVPADSFAVVTTTSGQLASVPVGQSVGILGAPDRLPVASGLVGTGWTACLDDDGAPTVGIAAEPAAAATDEAVVVRTEAGTFVVAGTLRYAVDAAHADAVLRAVGLGDAAVRPVDDRWLNLFDAGADLAPLVVPDAGEPVEGTSLVVGQAVHATGSAADDLYLVQADGTLAALHPLAYQLYLLGTGALQGPAAEVGAADLSGMRNADEPAGGVDWPADTLTASATSEQVCALATTGPDGPSSTLALGTGAGAAGTGATTGADAEAGSGPGALVLATGRGAQALGTVYLVDATGTAFPVEPDEETLARLGYATDDLVDIRSGWIALLPVGPTLSTTAAGSNALVTAPETP